MSFIFDHRRTDGKPITLIEIHIEASFGMEPEPRKVIITISLDIKTASTRHRYTPTNVHGQPVQDYIMGRIHRHTFPSLDDLVGHVARFVANEWQGEGLVINVGAEITIPGGAILGMGCQMVLQGVTPSDRASSDPIMRKDECLWSIRGLAVPCFVGGHPDEQKDTRKETQKETTDETPNETPKIEIDLRFWSKANERALPGFTAKVEMWEQLSQRVHEIVDKREFSSLEHLAEEVAIFAFKVCPLFRIGVACRPLAPLSMPSVERSRGIEIVRDREAMGIDYEAGSGNLSQGSA